MKETVKTFAPILGGLSLGYGIADLLEGNLIGIIAVVFGIACIGYTLHLIFRK